MTRSSLIVAAMLFIGCGGSGSEVNNSANDSGIGPSGVPSKPVDQLTADQKGNLCDWIAARGGGYGYRRACPDGSGITFYKDQAECVATHLATSCNATLYEQCALKFEEARLADRECDGSATKSAQCEAFVACVNAK